MRTWIQALWSGRWLRRLLVSVLAGVLTAVVCVSITQTQRVYNQFSGETYAAGAIRQGDVVSQQFQPEKAHVKRIGVFVEVNPEQGNNALYRFTLADQDGTEVFCREVSFLQMKTSGVYGFDFTKELDREKTYVLTVEGVDVPAGQEISLRAAAQNGEAMQVNAAAGGSTLAVQFGYYARSPVKVAVLAAVAAAVAFAALALASRLRVEYLTAAVILAAGVFLSVATPIMDTPDEDNHFIKSVMTSYATDLNGDFTQAKQIPEAYFAAVENRGQTFLHNTIDTAAQQKGDALHEADITDMSAISVYPFFGFLPQAAVLLGGRVLHIPLSVTFYLGRLANLLVYAVMAFFAVRLTPKLKDVFSIVAMSPCFLMIAASYNQDAMTYGTLLLAFAYFLRLYHRKTVSPKALAGMFLLCTLVSLLKYNFFPLILLFLLLLFEKHRPRAPAGKTHTALWAAGALAVFVGCIALWYFLVSTNFTEYRVPGVAAGDQVRSILQDPLGYTHVLVTGIFHRFSDWVRMSMTFGWLSYGLHDTVMLCYIVVVAFITCVYAEHIEMKKSHRIAVALMMLAIVGVTAVILYLTWTPVGRRAVEGVQGRYLFPLLLCIPLLMPKAVKCRRAATQYPVVCVGALFAMCQCITVFAVKYC